ncbi:MAG: LysM peptidoglycan-binding domain-containing protein [Peptococcaceae bacterium]|nr:LysM peptidoglycan-binding domain-containing protein [Peptococcaceae bacterium]
MSFETWLSFNNRAEVLQLPVTPFITVKTGQSVETVVLQKMGAVSIPGLRNADSINVESFFPAVGTNYNFLKCTPPDPWEAVKMIKRWKESRRPIRYIVTDTDINLALLIKGFDYGLEDKTKDVRFSLELVEYVFLDSPVAATAQGVTSENAVSGSQKGATTWRVRYGDTLTGIAKSVYGDTSRWKEIYEANKSLITDPNSLKSIEGKTLTIPQKKTMQTTVLTSETAEANSLQQRDSYVVRVGDTLTGIALAAYGDTSMWEQIWKANKRLIGDNPHSLKGIAGQNIKLPRSENVAYV